MMTVNEGGYYIEQDEIHYWQSTQKKERRNRWKRRESIAGGESDKDELRDETSRCCFLMLSHPISLVYECFIFQILISIVLTDDSTGSPVFPMMHNSTWQLKCLFTMTLNDWIIQPVLTFLCECGSVAWQRMSRWFSLPLMYFFPFSAVDIFPADSVMSAAIRSFFTIALKLAAPLTADKDALN